MALLQPMMVAALLVGGMGVALLGSVKVPLARRLHMDEARVGGLVSLFGFTLIPVILTAGFLTDLVGRQVVLVGGSALLAASLGLLAWARTYAAALAAVILLSVGWALLINVGNVLTPVAFPGSLAYATNLANVFFGAGAFLTPLAVALLIRRGPFPLALTALGVLSLVPAVLALGVDFAALAAQSALSATGDQGIGILLGDPVLWLCGFALFFYGPLEASLSAWATTYLGDQGVPEATASGLLSAFWLTFMASRLVTAFSLPPGREAFLILALALICVGVLAGLVVNRRRALAMALVVAAGAIFGPIFPTLLAVLLGHFAPSVHGRAVGMLFAVGGVGWTAIPLLIGAYARRAGVQRGFTIAAAAAVGLSGIAVLLCKQ
jgi:fucose permease